MVAVGCPTGPAARSATGILHILVPLAAPDVYLESVRSTQMLSTKVAHLPWLCLPWISVNAGPAPSSHEFDEVTLWKFADCVAPQYWSHIGIFNCVFPG